MATKISNLDPYPVPPDKIMECMKDKAYWDAKYPAIGAKDVTWHTFEEQGGEWVVSTTREVPANLPAFAKKVVGEQNIITQTDKWKSDGAGGYVVDVLVKIKGVPGEMKGWMKITPARDNEADWELEFTVNAGVPMIGKKLEGVMAGETKDNLVKEYEFNKQWMTTH
jgi:hypothetical protein